jgi:hypothetical protein
MAGDGQCVGSVSPKESSPALPQAREPLWGEIEFRSHALPLSNIISKILGKTWAGVHTGEVNGLRAGPQQGRKWPHVAQIETQGCEWLEEAPRTARNAPNAPYQGVPKVVVNGPRSP